MTRFVSILIVLGLALVSGFAAQPPELINYQGVLRDGGGEPLDGSYDMVFRLYDDPSAGSLLLTDAHLAAGSGSVTVVDGIFSVSLGSGSVTPGTAASLSVAFRDHGSVYCEIQV